MEKACSQTKPQQERDNMLHNGGNNGPKSKYHNTVGIYRVSNKEKYLGQCSPEYKSRLEAKMMFYLDHSPGVLKWTYESFPIKYVDESSNGKIRNYYIDFVAVVKTPKGPQTVWIEVKTESEANFPGPQARKNPETMKLWIKNQSKWAAARKLAESRGHKFIVITEKELNNG